MITIVLGEIEEVESFEFIVKEGRRITLSFNNENFSLQMPGGVDPQSISNTKTSFFLRSKDYAVKSKQ